jgi:hypothetical protein
MLNFSFALGLVFGFSILLYVPTALSMNECRLNSLVVRVYANELLLTSFASSCKVTVRLVSSEFHFLGFFFFL